MDATLLASIITAIMKAETEPPEEVQVLAHPMRGKFCLVRCRDAGVHAGIVMNVSGRAVALAEARRIWSWIGAFTCSELANSGLSPGSKLAEEVKEIELLEACEIIPCSASAEKIIRKTAAFKP